MATLDQLEQWIIDNQDQQGSDDWNDITAEYSALRDGEAQEPAAPPPPPAQEEPSFWDQLSYGFDSSRGITQGAIEEFAVRNKADKANIDKVLKEGPGTLLPGPFGAMQMVGKVLEMRDQEELERAQQRSALEKDLELGAEYPTIHNNPDAQGAGVMIGNIARQMLDPTLLLGPAAGTGIKGAMAINAAVGAADSAAMQALDEGEIDPGQVLLTAAVAAVAAPLIKGVGAGSRAAGKKVAGVFKDEKSLEAVEDLVVEGNARKRAYQKVGLNEKEATARAVKDISPKADAVKVVDGETVDLMETIQRGPQLGDGVVGMNTKKAVDARFRARFGTDKKMAKFEKKMDKAVAKEAKPKANVLTNIYRSAYDAMSRVSPRLANRLRRYEFDLATTIQNKVGKKGLNMMDDATGSVNRSPTIKAWKKFQKTNADDARDLKLAMFNGNTDELTRLAAKLPRELTQTIDTWRVLREEYRKAIPESGHGDLDWVEEYFPREFIDSDHMRRHFLKRGVDGKVIDQSKADLERVYKGDPDSLAKEKRIQTLSAHIRKPETGGVRVGPTSQMKSREIDAIMSKDLPAMRDPFETMAKYVNDVESNLAKRRLFGVDPNDLDNSIAARMDELVQTGDLMAADADLARRILQARFVTGERSMPGWAQKIRNSTNMMLLGNPASAAIQFGDVAVSAAYNGVRDTMRGLFATMGRSADEFNKIDLAITDVAAELNQVSQGGTGAALDWMLRKSGFKAMDTIGKNTNIRAAHRKLQRWTPAQVDKHYKDALNPNELTVLKEALKKPRQEMTPEQDELVRYALFNELSNTQPITLTELPVKYLEMQEGRLFYQLKSFTLKQLELVRREFWGRMKDNPVKAIGWLAKYGLATTLLTGNTEFVRDAMTGKVGTTPHTDDVEDYVLEGGVNLMMAATGGLNEFTIDKLMEGDLTGAVVDMFGPPALSVANRLYGAATDADITKAYRYIPYLGVFSPWVEDK